VPHNSASRIGAVFQQNPIHALFHGKELLISADFFDIVVIDDEIPDQVQQPGWMKQGDQRPILFPNLAIRGTLSAPVIQPFCVIFMPGDVML
jgi:hypothetical protein